MGKKKLLNYYIACSDCKIECEPTEEGILCPKCGAYISDTVVDDIGEFGE